MQYISVSYYLMRFFFLKDNSSLVKLGKNIYSYISMKSCETVLEYDKLKKIIGEFIQTIYGRKALDELHPVFDIDKAKNNFLIFNNFLDFFYKWGAPQLDDIYISPIMQDSHTVMLTPEELKKIGNFLLMLSNIKKAFLEYDGNYIYELYIGFDTLDEFYKKITRCIDDHGFIKDTASAKLFEIRAHMSELKDDITRILKNIMHSSVRNVLIDTNVFLKRSRYTLLMQANFKEYLSGRIVEISKTGNFFVEPDSVYSKNNTLENLIMKEGKEIRKILSELTNMVRKHNREFRYNEEKLGFLDMQIAKYRYHKTFSPCSVEFTDKSSISAKNVKHPILVHIKNGSVVGSDIDLNSDNKLIITGPNTGGKTVFLKNVGLLVMSVYSAIPPIADSVKIGPISGVYASIGDEQDIEASLSSFSAKMVQIKYIAEKVDENALVLLDEVGSGTSPEEGEAVAYAAANYFGSRCMVIATTHYRKLAHILKNSGFPTAAFEFNEENLYPTYNLIYDRIGKSYGIDIVSMLNLPDEIVNVASNFYEEYDSTFNKLTHDMEHTMNELEKKKKEFSISKSYYDKLISEEKDAKEQLIKRLNLEEQRSKKQYNRLINDIQIQLSRLIKQKKISEVHRKLDEVKKRAQNIFSDEEKSLRKPFKVGDEVEFGANAGIVVDIKHDRLKVELDGKSMIIPSKMANKVTKKPVKKHKIDMHSAKDETMFELNIIGKRRDEAEIELIRFLDHASGGSFRQVRIVHGIGSGILRQMVTENLESHPFVKKFHPALPQEGGYGATIAEFK